MQADLVKTYQFEAAHATPWQGDPARLHGHSFRVEIVVRGTCDPRLGWVMDYAEIGEQFDDLYRMLDHQVLGTVDGLNDTMLGGIRAWILERLSARIEALADVRVSICGEQVFAPKLLHADTAQGLPERVRFGFEAAHALPNLPPEHKCHTMHGHSFMVEVGADSMETLAPRLQEIYERLDHRCLNEVSGLENPTSEELARWIWNVLVTDFDGLRVVIVAETCSARCLYYGK